MASFREEKYHIEGYDTKFKDISEYKDALSVQELYSILGKYLEEGRLKTR